MVATTECPSYAKSRTTAAASKLLEVNLLYRKLELILYGIVITVSVGVGVMSERLDFRLQKQTLAAEIADTNQSFAFRLEAAISQLVAWANGMAAVVALKPNIEQTEFSAAAARLGTDASAVLNIALTTDGIIGRVFPYERNQKLVGTDLRKVPNQSDGIEMARLTDQPIFLGPVDLVQGGRGFIMRLAFSPSSVSQQPPQHREMITLVVDADAFFDEIGREAEVAGINTTISRIEDGAKVYGNTSVLEQQPIVNSLITPSSTWRVASIPAAGWPKFSERAPTIACLTLLRILIACAVLRTIFRLLRNQKKVEDQMTSAIDALDDGFALFDSEDRLTLSNRRYHDIYKTSEDLLVPGATFEEIIRGGVARGQYPDAIGQEEAWIEKRLESHRLGESVVEQRLDNNRWLRVAERKTRDGGIVGFRVDITDLKLATEAAQSAERAKSDFINVVSHELRTPLTIVIGYVGLMTAIRKLPMVDDLRNSLISGATSGGVYHLNALIGAIEEMASKAHRSAQHLLSLINHILDFSKIDSGKMHIDLTDVDIASILHDIDHLFRDVIEGKGLQFDVTPVDVQVRADPIRVRQILTNLVWNAVKFTETGSISVEALQEGGHVLFRVHDTGCGIPSELVGKVFGRFEQADSSSTRRAGGTGLGLAISKSMVEMMGGQIGFDSDTQAGSTFWFTLPLTTVGR